MWLSSPMLGVVLFSILSSCFAFRPASPLFMSSTRLFNSHNIEEAAFLTPSIGNQIRETYGTPVYVYDEKTLLHQASQALQFPHPYGLTVRFAMKACPNKAILQLFHSMGLHFDTSSGYECERAIRAGIPASSLSLSTQEKPKNLKELIQAGIQFNACSLSQLEAFGKLFPGGACGVCYSH